MEPPGPTVPDESTVQSEYCMDGEARRPYRNLPYPNGTIDESSEGSEYYPSGETEEDGTTATSDSNLGTYASYPEIDIRNTVSSASPPHSIRLEDHPSMIRSSSASSSTSSTSSASSSISYTFDSRPASPESFENATPDIFPVPRGRVAAEIANLSSFSESSEPLSSWPEDIGSVELQSPDDILLTDVIPSPYCDLVMNSLEGKHHYTPVQLYEALGDAIDAVRADEKWKVAEAEDPIERARRLRKLRADDEIRSAAAAPEAYSRACGVCFTESPATRAVLTACGHLVCASCAETLADGGGRVVCPYCRANTGFVVLVEEEEEEEGSDATEDEISGAESKEEID